MDLKLGRVFVEKVCSVLLPSRKSVSPIHPRALAFEILEIAGHFYAVDDEDVDNFRYQY